MEKSPTPAADAPAMPEQPKIPVFSERKQLQEYMSQEFGEDVLNDVEKAKDNVERRRLLIQAMREKHPELNGQAEKAADRLLLNKQELERKEGVFTRILKAPARGLKWTWQKTFVEHPYITTTAVVAIVAVLLLTYTPLGAMTADAARRLIAKYFPGMEGAQEVAQKAAEKAKDLKEAAGEGLRKVAEKGGSIADAAKNMPQPVPPPAPPTLPAPEVVEEIIKRWESGR